MTFAEFACFIDLNPISKDGKTTIAVYVRSESDDITTLKPHLYSNLVYAIRDYGDRKIDQINSMIVHPNGVAFWLE